jgi:hypothetical protein
MNWKSKTAKGCKMFGDSTELRKVRKNWILGPKFKMKPTKYEKASLTAVSEDRHSRMLATVNNLGNSATEFFSPRQYLMSLIRTAIVTLRRH